MLQAVARQSVGFASKGANGERVKNGFLRPNAGVSEAVVLGRTGLTSQSYLGGPVRAVLPALRGLYAVAGGKLWQVDGGAVELGPIADDVDTYMAANSSQIAIVAGGFYYIWDGVDLGLFSTGAVDNPSGLAYLDGYFVVSGSIGGREGGHTVSALDDGKTFGGLDFAFAESNPDEIVSVVEDHGEIWFLGRNSVEVWYNSGGADYPLAKRLGAEIEHGCLNGGAVAKADNAVFWVTDKRTVVRASGSSPQVISTREIEEILIGSQILGGFTYQDRGHLCYVITIDEAPTLVYDITTGLWHEVTTGIGDAPWIGRCAAPYAGDWYVGTTTGKICTLSGYTDDGDVIDLECVSIPIEQGGSYFPVSEVFVALRSGSNDLGRDAEIMMQTTRDGYNWGVERWRKIGRLGERYTRVRWNGLGTFERFQIRLRITDPVERDIYGVNYG